MKKNSAILLVGIVALAVLVGFFVYPKNFGANTRPWRLGLDLVGGTHLVYEVDMANVTGADRDSVLNGLRDVIEKRVNLFGVSEPQVFIAKGADSYRLVVELAGIKDVSEAIKLIGETPLLTFAEVLYEKPKEGETATMPEGEPKFLPLDLSGRHVSGAQLNFDQLTGKPEVSISFNSDGAKLFEDITAKNVGKPIAIFLDGILIEMPVVQEKISGGRAQITGRFTVQEAKQLVERFNAGALPAPVKLVSQQTIGASLGTDSLKRTLYAGLIGTLVVMLFMMLYYRVLGMYAALALAIYVALTLGVFKLFGVTMTLAGVAGFILSIGMAVDANVLIFERSKEEMKKGLSRMSALDEGFSRAWLSIRDSNVSTMLTSVILYYATTGFVKGFALTLFIGVLMSMFSAITVTRTILRVFTRSEVQAK
ncbi:MAG: protein translocase subunit SecD [Candidatus Harrisonbacteria bacterium]|nr:protein translocase subunit SecD [Candidatus Harrisonbacteria bacterium]